MVIEVSTSIGAVYSLPMELTQSGVFPFVVYRTTELEESTVTDCAALYVPGEGVAVGALGGLHFTVPSKEA